MRRTKLAAAAVLALTASLVACKQPGTSVSNTVAGTPDGGADEPGVENMGTAATPAGAAQNPAGLVTALAASDLFEIQSGQLAQQKGQSSDVKSMGAMLVEEHTKSSNELKAILARSSPPVSPPVSPPTALPPELQSRLQALQGLSSAEFDRRWIAEQTASHQRTLAALNGFLGQAQPGPLKDHAAKSSGVIQKHLNDLRNTQPER